VDQQPGPPIGHAHILAGSRYRSVLGNKLHQGDLARSKITEGAEVDADGKGRLAQITALGSCAPATFSWSMSHEADGQVGVFTAQATRGSPLRIMPQMTASRVKPSLLSLAFAPTTSIAGWRMPPRNIGWNIALQYALILGEGSRSAGTGLG